MNSDGLDGARRRRRAAAGADRGCVNGYLTAYVGINSLIVTLGTMFVMRGGIYLYTGQRAIPDDIMLESFYLSATDGCSTRCRSRR